MIMQCAAGYQLSVVCIKPLRINLGSILNIHFLLLGYLSRVLQCQMCPSALFKATEFNNIALCANNIQPVMLQGQADKYCTTRFYQSSYQKASPTVTSSHSPAVHNRRDSEPSQNRIFDCVKTPNETHVRKESSSSLGSLFQSCRRPSESDNECSNRSYNRSDSAHSSGSQSFTFNHHNSRTSLASNVSCRSKLSYPDYTEEELNMLDGDEPTYESDLRRVRNYHVVTTAGEFDCLLIHAIFMHT